MFNIWSLFNFGALIDSAAWHNSIETLCVSKYNSLLLSYITGFSNGNNIYICFFLSDKYKTWTRQQWTHHKTTWRFFRLTSQRIARRLWRRSITSRRYSRRWRKTRWRKTKRMRRLFNRSSSMALRGKSKSSLCCNIMFHSFSAVVKNKKLNF